MDHWKQRSFATSAALVLSVAAAHATLVNASFEDPALNPGQFTTNGINGWSNSAGIKGVWRPVSYFSEPVPDGEQVGIINSGSVAQTSSLSVVEGSNSFSVWFGRRLDGFIGSGYIAMYAGGTVANGDITGATLLLSIGFDAAVNIEVGEFSQFSGNYEALAGNPNIGQAISIVIAKTGGNQIAFDQVEVTNSSVPEPTALSALGLGLVAILRRKPANSKR